MQKLRQLGDVEGDPPRLVAGEQLGRRPAAGVVLGRGDCEAAGGLNPRCAVARIEASSGTAGMLSHSSQSGRHPCAVRGVDLCETPPAAVAAGSSRSLICLTGLGRGGRWCRTFAWLRSQHL
jgi:hypothetical protein